MKVTVTPAHALTGEGQRLDASYHASPGVQALRTLRDWASAPLPPAAAPGAPHLLRDAPSGYTARRLDRLVDVCVPGGVFIPGRFKRIYVDDPAHGVPYLTGGDIMKADPIAGAKFLSRRYTSNVEELALRQRMTLITCSGTIGNTVYVNQVFEGSVGSPDLIRVIADPDKIPPGYLYAYLSSPLGRTLIEQKTYGAVIPHIEAHHVVDLPIPRLDATTEERIHGLIEQAAQLRAEANELLAAARFAVYNDRMLPPLTTQDYHFYGNSRLGRSPGMFVITSDDLTSLSLHAWNYGDKFKQLREIVRRSGESAPLRDAIVPNGYYTGSWYKRIPVDKSQGIELISQKELFGIRKQGGTISALPISRLEDERVTSGTILVAGVGTIAESEVFGRTEFVWSNFEDKLVVAEVIRIIPNDNVVDPGFLYAFLSSDYGFRLIRSTISGTKLCRFIAPLMLDIPIPMCRPEIQAAIGNSVRNAYDNRAKACKFEDGAQELLASTFRIRQ